MDSVWDCEFTDIEPLDAAIEEDIRENPSVFKNIYKQLLPFSVDDDSTQVNWIAWKCIFAFWSLCHKLLPSSPFLTVLCVFALFLLLSFLPCYRVSGRCWERMKCLWNRWWPCWPASFLVWKPNPPALSRDDTVFRQPLSICCFSKSQVSHFFISTANLTAAYHIYLPILTLSFPNNHNLFQDLILRSSFKSHWFKRKTVCFIYGIAISLFRCRVLCKSWAPTKKKLKTLRWVFSDFA